MTAAGIPGGAREDEHIEPDGSVCNGGADCNVPESHGPAEYRTPPTTPGQDGGEREVLGVDAWFAVLGVVCGQSCGRRSSHNREIDPILAALDPVVADLVRVERDRVRRECAEELRMYANRMHRGLDWWVAQSHLLSLAASWTVDEGEQ